MSPTSKNRLERVRKTVRFEMLMEPEYAEGLQRLAAKDGVSQAACLRNLIRAQAVKRRCWR